MKYTKKKIVKSSYSNINGKKKYNELYLEKENDKVKGYYKTNKTKRRLSKTKINELIKQFDNTDISIYNNTDYFIETYDNAKSFKNYKINKVNKKKKKTKNRRRKL
tara:strand:+ start:267 stop:584 length:318 start_codon:yes stop_codon:yes gene_type:complete